MEAFEKYANNRWNGQMTDADLIYRSHEKTWRASLEWVDLMFYEREDVDIKGRIEKELEE